MNVLSLGDLLLDLVVRYDPLSGEADAAPEAVQLWPGGSAANFAVWAARCGASVRFVSRVGRDLPGETLIRSLEDESIIPSVRVVDDLSTGRVLVMVDPEGTRRMWSYPGASATISPDDLDPAWFYNLDAFHLTGYSLLREGPSAAALHALHLARAHGSPLCTLDPNPPHLIAGFGPGRFRDILKQVQFDIIFPNLEEARLLTTEDAPEAMAADLLSLSPVVVLTLGEQGCLIAASAGAGLKYAPMILRVEPAPVQTVRDVTGAGDAFAAAFVVEYLRTDDLRASAQVANNLAAQVVSRVGAR